MEHLHHLPFTDSKYTMQFTLMPQIRSTVEYVIP